MADDLSVGDVVRAAILEPMSRPPSSRRLATVLFLDIVDSTRIAAELGDRRWRELLGTFRQIVRKELKSRYLNR